MPLADHMTAAGTADDAIRRTLCNSITIRARVWS